MVGGANRKDDSLVLNSTNVFAALGTLRKKKSDKESGPSKGKGSAKKKPEEKVVDPQVFWTPTKLTATSWADVDDEDDDDYYANTAPPQVLWADSPDKEEAPALVEGSESEEEGLDEVDDDENEEEHDHEADLSVGKDPAVSKVSEVSLPPPKDAERQLSKKELKKKELAELDAVLAELGLTNSEAGGEKVDSLGSVQEEKKIENPIGEEEKKESALGESKTAKKKKKKEKVKKEAKEEPVEEESNNNNTGSGAEDTSIVDVKEKIKKVALMKKKKSSKEMDGAARAAASEAAARSAKLAAAKKKEKNHYNQQPVR